MKAISNFDGIQASNGGSSLLAPGAFTVVWCSGDGTEGADYAAIRLAKAGESVILTDADGNALDRIQTPFLADDTAYARVSGEWCVTNRPTPGFANTEEGYAAFAASRGFGDVAVQITEVCLRSEAGLRDADGDSPDWIELYNAGTESVSLDGWYLSDDPEEPARWRIPDITSFSPPAKTGRRASCTRTLPSPRARA